MINDDFSDWVDLVPSAPSGTGSDIINEQAELSEIETGGKGAPDFDEMMQFIKDLEARINATP